MDNLMKNDFLKTIQMNVPMNMNMNEMQKNRNIHPEADHMRSAVSLLVHFKYILLYVKEHFFIDIDYKIDSFAPQLKSDLDQCHQLYNQLVNSSKYLEFIRGKENNYHAKSPIYNAFKSHSFVTHQHDPNQDINAELQNLYSNMVYGDGSGANSAQPFETNQTSIEHFRPLNEYEYFQSNALAAGHAVEKYQHAQCQPNYVNQMVTTTVNNNTNNNNNNRRNYTGYQNNNEGTTQAPVTTTNNNRKQPKPKRPAAPRPKKEKKEKKKRKRTPEEWIRNKAKANRNAGLEYISINKKVMPAKKVQPPCENCIHKCTTKINEQQRKDVFDAYWALPNINMKRMYLASCLTQITPKYRYPKGKKHARKLNNAFHFKLNGSMIRICKKFFMKTLDIADRTIQTVIRKSKSCGTVEEDKRGKCSKRVKKSTIAAAAAAAAAATQSSTTDQPPTSQTETPQSSSKLAQSSSSTTELPQSSAELAQSDLSQSTQLSQSLQSGDNCDNSVNNSAI